MSTDHLLDLLPRHHRGVLSTLERDGRPQLSDVGYAYDAAGRVIRISVTDTRAKTRNLRRDPRASFLVTPPDLGAYVVIESVADLAPVTTDPHDATADDLVALYREIAGEHPDWQDFRAAMVHERRLLLRRPVGCVYGWNPGT